MEYQTCLGGTMNWLIAGFALLLTLSSAAELQLIDPEQRLPVLQGATNASSAQFSILYSGTDRPIVTVVADNDGQARNVQNPEHIRFEKREYSEWQAIKVFFQDLVYGPGYYLEVRNSTGKLVDRRKFSLVNTQANKVRLVFVSCSSDELLLEQGPMWRSLIAARPDLLIMLGDNVYVDRPRGTHPTITARYIWQRYVETRNNLDIYKTAHLIPTLATWDDHDYGENDAGRHYPKKVESKYAFMNFWEDGKNPVRMEHEGIYDAVHIRDGNKVVQILLLDTRTFRSDLLPAKDKKLHRNDYRPIETTDSTLCSTDDESLETALVEALTMEWSILDLWKAKCLAI